MILALAMLLDGWLGEPNWLWRRLPHPAVLMGRAVEALENRLNRPPQKLLGGVTVLLLVLVAGGIGWVLASLHDLIALIVAAILLAQRSLVEHVAAVAAALRQGLPEGRQAVSMIVGRDTAQMDAPQIARAAIESAAENLSDGVIAPVFWFVVAGLPGMLIYKIINTADSTVGYRTPRFEAYGWAAARLDDVVNWIPARLTGLLIASVTRIPLRGLGADAALHRSPNAGWPEAAMARALGVALSGPRSYDGTLRQEPWVNATGRQQIGAIEIEAAIRVLWQVWTMTLGLVVLGSAGGFWLAWQSGGTL